MPRQGPGIHPARGERAARAKVYQATEAGSGFAMTGYDMTVRGTAGPIDLAVAGPYDVTVHDPDGFVTRFAGDTLASGAGVEVAADVAHGGELRLTASNATAADVELSVRDLLSPGTGHGDDKVGTLWLAPGERETLRFDPLHTARGRYDLSVTIAADPSYVRRFAGHIRNGEPDTAG